MPNDRYSKMTMASVPLPFAIMVLCHLKTKFINFLQSYWASGIHVWSPLPFSRYFGGFGDLFRTHLFYNFGTCNTFTTGKAQFIEILNHITLYI